MVKKVVIPAINSVLTVVVFGSKPNNAFNLFITYITIVFSLFSLPHFQNLVILFSGRTKIIKNNEECLILQISAYQNALFYIFQGIQTNKSSRVTDALNISEYSLLTSSEFPTYVRRSLIYSLLLLKMKPEPA